MHSTVGFFAIAIPIALSTSGARADVTISSQPTENMTCSAGVCAPTAKDAVLNVAELEVLLASGTTEVTTTGTEVQANNIVVSDALTWKSANTLMLDAFRSIIIAKPVFVHGSASLALTTDDGGTNGALFFQRQGKVTFAKLSSNLSINGTTYTLVNTIKSLASAIANDPSGNFALAADYDASADGTYTTSPIGTTFSGHLEGLSNRISKLSINNNSNDTDIGLFAAVGNDGVVDNILLKQVSIRGEVWVGAFAGENNGHIFHVSVGGIVTGSNTATAGGLVGGNWGTIDSSSATTPVESSGPAGGLAGANTGIITNSFASGAVSAEGIFVGGLVGWSETQSAKTAATVSDCFASGAVTDTAEGANTGGLLGLNSGVIRHSHATGSVVGGVDAGSGGLVGLMLPDLTFPKNGITDSYATGTVTSGDQGYVGGLVGGNGGAPVDQSYATGAISGGASTIAGGLVGVLGDSDSIDGILVGTIKDSYALGNIIGGQDAVLGGLVGEISHFHGYAGTIGSSYSIGNVSGETGSLLGGSIGWNRAHKGNIDHDFWDTVTSGTDVGVGQGNRRGIKGLTTTQLQSGLPPGFRPTIWSEKSTINNGLPYLIHNPPN